MIDVARLIACGVAPNLAKVFAAPLATSCDRFSVASVMQQAGLIAQSMHESLGLARLEESLFYSTADRIRQIWPTSVPSLAIAATLTKKPQELANVVYAGKNGNGDQASGDGWRYRGRGCFGLTGRGNYRDAGQALGVDLVASPELVATPELAAATAAWFWSTKGCNADMQAGDFDRTTRRINPAMVGAIERRALYAACQEALR